MSLAKMSENSYIIVSTDIDENSKVPGLGIVGAFVYATDTQMWYVVQPDLALAAVESMGASVKIQVGSSDVSTNNPVPITVVSESNNYANVLLQTPPLDSGAYGSGDVLFIPLVLSNATKQNGGTSQLSFVEITDKDDNGGALELVFLKTTQDVGTINNALDLTDTESLEILGWVEVAAADYKDFGGQKVAFLNPNSTGWKVNLLKSANDSPNIYVFGISRDTKTYTTTGMQIQYGVHYL